MKPPGIWGVFSPFRGCVRDITGRKGGHASNISDPQTVTGYEPYRCSRRPMGEHNWGKPQKRAMRAMNNTSMFTADRMTHLKIVVVSLVCATVVAGIGVTARLNDAGNGRLEATTIKASTPMTAANEVSQIR